MAEVQIKCLDFGFDVDLRAELFTGKTIMDLFNLLLKHNNNNFKQLILALSKVIPDIVKDAHEVSQINVFQSLINHQAQYLVISFSFRVVVSCLQAILRVRVVQATEISHNGKRHIMNH